MGLRDEIIHSLRQLFGVDAEERAKAESPSADAARYAPTSIYSVWGREDVGGLLSVSQNLMDRFADYEAMLDYPDIRTAVHYFATDSTQPNPDNGRVVWITAKDQALVGSGDAMIVNRLRLEDDAFSIAFQLCAMGNDYEEMLCTENGVVGINCLPPATMRRVEKINGDLIGYIQDITGRFSADPDELRKMIAGAAELPPTAATFEPWQVVHFRLRSHARRSPYGIAIQEAARWIWKRLVMLEDAVLMGRLTKIPRYAYYVDVTDVPPKQRDAYLRKHKAELRKKQMVDPKTGRLDMRFNPMALDEDIVLATTRDGPLAKVDVLSAPDFVNMHDVDHFQRKMHGALMVPRAYMGQDSPVQGRAILSTEDVRAARVTLQVQKELRNGFERMIRIDQAARGFPNPWQTQFQVNMTMPSGIYELASYEIKSARADFAARIKPWFSDRWIRENVFKISDEAIVAIEDAMRREAIMAAQTQAQVQAIMMGAGGGGGPSEGAPTVDPAQLAAAQPVPPEQLGTAPALPVSAGPPRLPPPGSPDRMEAIKRYDHLCRLEEQRDKLSNANHQFLTDKVQELLAGDKVLQDRLNQAIGLINDVRELGLRSNGDRLAAIPSARRRW